MAANSDGHTELTTVLTCEGNLSDPAFPAQLDVVVGRLNDILGDTVKVHKLEPWNSVRVTLSIPREAALRLRQLANGGSQQLRALGILSVQVEGDQVISLQVASGALNSEPQEIVLRTAQDGGSTDRRDADMGLSFLSSAGPSAINPPNSQVQFKSPNVVCPSDSVVPRVGTTATATTGVSSAGKAFAGPFPFASMNQAIHSNRETAFSPLPPPYPGKHPPVTISSPLLVNLLQNDGSKEAGGAPKLPQAVTSARPVRTPPVTVHKPAVVATATAPTAVTVASTNSGGISTFAKPTVAPTQANVLVNNNGISPSALSTNTSVRQNSTTLTSTTVAVNKTPPPHYHRPLPATLTVKQQPLSGLSTTTMSAATVTSQLNSLPQTSLPQQNCSTASQAIASPQTGLFHQTQTKNPLLQTSNHITQPNILTQASQPVVSPPLGNVPLPQQNTPKVHHSIAMPVMKSVPVPSLPMPQSKNPSLNNTLPQAPMSLLKSALPQGISATKTVNSFLSRPIKSPASFTQSNTLSQANSTALSSPFTTIASANVPNCGDSGVNTTVIPSQSQAGFNNIMSRSLPSPPPYSVAISRPWDTLVHGNNSILDLTPSLTDLKPGVLDELLPTLERELTHSPLPELPEDFLSVPSNITATPPSTAPPVEDNRKFLINPLTGELEPHSGGESDNEEPKDVFTGLPSPAALSDDDTSSTIRPDATTDHSDSETRSGDAIKQRIKNPKARERGRDSPALKQEKIKLRLKLEKSEPVNPAYKVDVSFINTQPKKAAASMMSTAGEELRVPPLHISLRGRNSVVIKNKTRLNPDGTPAKPKVRKSQDHLKMKKGEGGVASVGEELSANASGPTMAGNEALDLVKAKMNSFEQKKVKKFKSIHEHKDMVSGLNQEKDLKTKFIIHNHYKDKQKERRGSDSDLVRNNKKYADTNGIVLDEKKRRLSQAEQLDEDKPSVLGSTNVGTIAGLPQKPRKDKTKIKDVFKKDPGRSKIFAKSFGEKSKQVALPTAGEMNMEAKFKQGLLEGTGEKGVVRPPHRTEVINHVTADSNRSESVEKVTKAVADAPPVKDKSPEPDKCNTPDRKSAEPADKQTAVVVTGGGRSPNSGTGQGEDSGIESMDALSEKSPNQAGQSPHADILPPTKTQVPIMLDIEAQLAKMEGLNGDARRPITDRSDTMDVEVERGGDVNENKCRHDHQSSGKLKQCCELTCALQDSLKQGAVSLTAALSPAPQQIKQQQPEISLVSLKVKKEENLDPLPLRVTPALYTYSNPDKTVRGSSESPALSDEDSNSCSTNSTTNSKQNRSLLEQLLIEIPNDHQTVPSSPSPATRSSVRTRALSKLSSPELGSPVPKNTRTAAPIKRKRNESDSSNHSLEETKKKPRKVSEPVLETVKTRQGEPTKTSNVKKAAAKVQQEESSDSDEPLIEKLRKPTTNNSINTHGSAKGKVKGMTTGVGVGKVVMSTRRSVRSNMPAQNTRSKGDKMQSETEALRRKTRSAGDVVSLQCLVAELEATSVVHSLPTPACQRNARSVENMAAVCERVWVNPRQTMPLPAQKLCLSQASNWRILCQDVGLRPPIQDPIDPEAQN